MGYPYAFQIGTSVAGLIHLPRWGIAWPDDWTYQPWAVAEVRADGTRAGFGYPRATWSWDNMGQAALHRLLNRFDSDTDATVAQYIRTYLDTGGVLEYDDFLCLMHRPVDGSGKTLHGRVRASVAAYSNVSIEFTRLEAQ